MTLLLFQHGILKCKLIQGLVQVSVGLSQVHQSRPKPVVLPPKWSSDVAGGLTAPTVRKIAILVPSNVVEVAVAIDHQHLPSSISDGSCTCESCCDSTVDVAHPSPFVDVHLYLLEAGVVGVGPMLRPVLHGAPGVVATYK